MKLYGNCKNCKSEIKFNFYGSTRVDYAMKEGDFKELKCESCGSENKIHINDVKAKKSKIAMIIALSIFLI